MNLSPENIAAAPGVARDQRRTVAGICLGLAALVLATFGKAVTYKFVNFDDNEYVYSNPVVSRGLTLKGAVWAFSHAYSANWHPITWLSHMLDCELYGLNPGGHHLTNVLLHTLTVIALFLVLRQMTGALWRSAFVAAVFAIHPLRVESVAWVAERKDVLSGLFFVLTLGAYLRLVRHPWSFGRYGLVLFLFALGLMCKQMLVTLPIVLLLLDYWPLRRSETIGRLILEKIPLFALSAAASVVTLTAQNKAIEMSARITLWARLVNALVSCCIYLRQMIWPAKLAVFYPFPTFGLPPWEVALACGVLLAFSVSAIALRKTQPWLATGWFWYLVMLLPVLGIVQVGGQGHADRYTYLPHIGVYMALVWLTAELGAKAGLGRAVFGPVMGTIIVTLAICTWQQLGYWKNGETLWLRALDCTTDNVLARYNYAILLLDDDRIDESIVQCRLALKIAPNDARPHVDLGAALLRKNDVDGAIKELMRSLQIDPNDAAAHQNFGRALVLKKKIPEAAAHFLKAIELKPDYSQAHFRLGELLFNSGRIDAAIAQYQQAIDIEPEYAAFHSSLGNALLRKGEAEAAAAEFERTLQIRPDYAQADYNLGNILLQAGKLDEAIAHYRSAVAHDPKYAQAFVNLGVALRQKGDADDALRQFQNAIALEPTNAPALFNLGEIFLQRNQPEDAIAQLQKAVQISPRLAEARSSLAQAFVERGKMAEAVAQFQSALQLEPNNLEIQNNLAWLLATSSNGAIRNGARAVQLAEQASKGTAGKNPVVLRTLAAAYAETGQFDNARRTAQMALELTRAAGRQALAAELAAELKTYQSGVPLRQ